jgi:iron uptake system component EfeO
MRTTICCTLAAAAAAATVVLAGCGSAGTARKAGGQTLAVKLTDAGCSPASLKARAGSVTFDVSNGGSGKVTELELKNRSGIILGERENVVAGISGSFTLNLEPGRYVLSCPNGDREDGTLVVAGHASRAEPAVASPELTAATRGYGTYVAAQTAQLLSGVQHFVAALRAGDLAEAKRLFGPARFHYEAIEPVAESFGDLDPAIDARANDVADGAEWTGFHRIEQILWVRGTTAGTAPYAARLLRDVQKLSQRAGDLEFQPAQLANGAVELLNEVANSKITGEEDRYSHTDLSDFAGNLAGAKKAFELLRPALVRRGDGALAKRIAARFAAVERGLDAYERPTALGWALYGDLTQADRQRLAKLVGNLAEPLSTVAARVAA